MTWPLQSLITRLSSSSISVVSPARLEYRAAVAASKPNTTASLSAKACLAMRDLTGRLLAHATHTRKRKGALSC
jgi:hypothetical protein